MNSVIELVCPTKLLSPRGASHFFGYYDKSPWHREQVHLGVLAHRTKLHKSLPVVGNSVQLGLVDPNGHFSEFAKSSAWNFQQGSMLQWLNCGNDELVYNDCANGLAIGVRQSLEKGVLRIYDRAFAAVSPCGNEALSIDFGRLTELKPEYGYAGVADAYSGQACPAEAGIWRTDLNSGATTFLISLRDIAYYGDGITDKNAVHYLNHLMYSRDGKKFCFLHRYINSAGTQFTRLFVCDRDGSNVKLLISGMASHFGWGDDRQLLAWAGERKLMNSATSGGLVSHLPIGRFLKWLYRALGKPARFKASVLNDRYILFDVMSGSSRTICKGLLTTDGHCSFSPDGKWFVTDTYPDRNGEAHLLVGHLESEAVYLVASFRMPPELDGEVRCDLHPRWHPNQARICVDVANHEDRQIYEVDISSLPFIQSAR